MFLFWRIAVVPTIISDHTSMKLEVNCVNKTRKFTNTWRFNNVLLNKQQVKEVIKRNFFKMLYQNNKTTISQLSCLIFTDCLLSDILVDSLLALTEHSWGHTCPESPFPIIPHSSTLLSLRILVCGGHS